MNFFSKESRILVIAAHPDDEILGCGGTLARAIDASCEVMVHFLGEGISARFPVGKYDSEEFKIQSNQRNASSRAALSALGIKNVRYSERLCCQFDTYPILSLVKEIEESINSFKPTIILTHNPSEVNIDHRITFHAVETAVRPTEGKSIKNIYTFEIVCSGNWTLESSFKPNVYVDISKFWDKKIKAWHCFEAESRPYPFPRSDMGLETLARFRGMTSGLEKAEAFRLVRGIV